jgi:hypothetical protein
MTDPVTLAAREAIAAKQVQPYNKRAIIAGEWDAGKLVQDEIARLLREREEAEGE